MNKPTDLERKKIEQYFAAFPKWAVWSIVAGVPLLAVYGLGLLPLAAGGVGLYLWMNDRVSDSQIDQWMTADRSSLYERALQKCGIDESLLIGDPPFTMIYGPAVEDEILTNKKGKDGQQRFVCEKVVVLMYAEHQLLAYHCVINFVSGDISREGSDEFFYQHIVSTAVREVPVNFRVRGRDDNTCLDIKTFQLQTAGGNQISVTIPDRRLLDELGGGDAGPTDVDKQIQCVRTMVREKAASV